MSVTIISNDTVPVASIGDLTTRSSEPTSSNTLPSADLPAALNLDFRKNLNRLLETGLFREDLTRVLLQPLAQFHPHDVTTSYGLGCATSDRPSQGVPIERLAMDFRAQIMHRIFDIKAPPVCLICRDLAFANPSMEQHREAINAIADKHSTISAKLIAKGFRLLNIVDSEFTGDPVFQLLQNNGAAPERQGNAYSKAQDARFEYLSLGTDRHLPAIIKGGWAIEDGLSRVAYSAKAAIESGRGMDEAAFDHFTRMNTGDRLGFYYGTAALHFGDRDEAACPYTAKSKESRILLENSPEAIAQAAALYDSLLQKASGRTAKNNIALLKTHWEIYTMAAQLLPDVPQPKNSLAEMELVAKSAHAAIATSLQQMPPESYFPRSERAQYRSNHERLSGQERQTSFALWQVRREILKDFVTQYLLPELGA